MSDPYTLSRFVQAQDSVYERVLLELRQGRKETHWMWFVFPQVDGLGQSGMSRRFALAGRAEAAAYAEHPILGPRLRECTGLVNAVEGRTIQEIFGYPDFQKFRSSMTLFARAAAKYSEFLEALRRYFGGEEDRLTLDRLD